MPQCRPAPPTSSCWPAAFPVTLETSTHHLRGLWVSAGHGGEPGVKSRGMWGAVGIRLSQVHMALPSAVKGEARACAHMGPGADPGSPPLADRAPGKCLNPSETRMPCQPGVLQGGRTRRRVLRFTAQRLLPGRGVWLGRAGTAGQPRAGRTAGVTHRCPPHKLAFYREASALLLRPFRGLNQAHRVTSDGLR